MSSNKPLISVGMPVYNESKWIEQSLDSLLAQTFQDFELIISDNASTDGTWSTLQEYAARDARIVLHRQPENRNALINFQFVLEHMESVGRSGIYLQFLNLIFFEFNDLSAFCANHMVMMLTQVPVFVTNSAIIKLTLMSKTETTHQLKGVPDEVRFHFQSVFM